MTTTIKSHPQETGWADGLLLLTVLFWGVNFSVVKFALAEIPPLAFNGLRFVLVVVLMVGLNRAAGHRLSFQRRHLLYLVGLGLISTTLYQLCFILGLKETTADNSSLILATVPAWVALFGTLAGTERVLGRGWLGVLLSLAGIGLLIMGGSRHAVLHFGTATLRGDALILGGTLCWSLYTLAIRPLSRYYPATALTSIITLIGTIPLILIATPSLTRLDWAGVSPAAWAAVVISGLFGITLPYFFWNYGVARLGSARTSFYSNLTPPVSLLTAWLVLGETLTPLQGVGAVLALVGVVLARQYTRPVSERPK